MEKRIEIEMGRRQFLGAAAAALFAGIAVQILGCDSSTGTSGEIVAKTGAIAAPSEDNHPVPGQHIATLTQAQVDAGGAMTVHIQGNAGHDHTISLAASDMAAIKAGTTISQMSTSTDGHTHTVTFN